MQTQRRDFLKITAAGAAGLVLVKTGRTHAAWPSTGALEVNPNIDNMRVVSCVDTQMMKSAPKSMTFAAENAVVDTCRVHANMDAMAMQLANTTSADAAWKAIFRSSKPWASTLVAIKVNVIEPMNMARIAVVQKFCNVLAGFGVPPANIIVYDGNTTFGSGLSSYNSYFSLTDTTKIQAVVSGQNSAALGGTVSAAIPDKTTATCTKQIADGTVDILINIANNKGHSMMGGATLSMKNHFGTFAPNHTNLANYVFNINKSDAILGGTPVRQQLCFIDSLIANKANNTGTPEVMPCYLIMGVFGPAVDYLTVKKVREAVMGCTHDAATINSFMTSFGYATTDPVWVVVPPAAAGCDVDAGTSADGSAGTGGSGGNGGSASSGGGGSGGAHATGGSDGGGVTGSAGSSNGGTRATGGAGSGGVTGSAGSNSGGTRTTGAASGGSSNSGGSSESPGSGGSISGGSTHSSASGLGGKSGTTTSATVASGGSSGAGGASSASGSATSSGCGCDLGGISRSFRPWGLLSVFGAVVVGVLHRLVERRKQCAQDTPLPDQKGGLGVALEKKHSNDPTP